MMDIKWEFKEFDGRLHARKNGDTAKAVFALTEVDLRNLDGAFAR